MPTIYHRLVSAWDQAPADVQQILAKVRGPLATPYTADAMNLSAFSGDPTQIPLLFFSGSRTIKFDEKQIELIRNYVMRGGVVFGVGWVTSASVMPFFFNISR